MTDLRQAAQQALEALTIYSDAQCSLKGRNAITALKAALEQPQQEPVAWFSPSGALYRTRFHAAANGEQLLTPLYTTPPAAQPDGYGYALRLAVAIWEQHYKDVAPQWKPLDDLMGVLTQIDNMTSGLVSPPAAQWDKPSASFNAWWDSDVMPPANPFAEGSAAFWAWAGWRAAQRSWVGLTDDQIDEIAVIARRGNLHDLRIAIEAKLKERNT
jgi:hypothetical protein